MSVVGERASLVSQLRKIGIDLGTTFSVISTVNEQGEPFAIPNAEGKLTTPSAVHAESGGSLIVGARALEYPTDTALIFKRYMGRTDHFDILAGRRFSPEDLSAAVLRKLAADAAAYLGEPIHEVVVTVPANFGQAERQATRQAGELAGLHVNLIINEPRAAAMVWLRRNTLREGHVLVFDLGGGTLDITVLELTPRGCVVRMTRGVSDIGGQDFTNDLVVKYQAQYEQQHHVAFQADDLLRLNRQVEAAKIALSNVDRQDILVQAGDGPAMTIAMTRADLEAAARPHIFRMQRMTYSLLHQVNLKPTDIGKVLLVGGSTRVPAVREMLRQVFSQEPDASLDADLAVSWGAALGELDDTIVQDAVNHDIRVRARPLGAASPVLEPVLMRGKVPLGAWSDVQLFRPASLGAEQITVHVYQSDGPEYRNDGSDERGPSYLGYLAVDIPPDVPPEQARIEVRMRLNASSILEVSVAINGGDAHTKQLILPAH